VTVESGGPSGAKLKKTGTIRGLTSDEAARVLALMKDAKTESVAIDAIRPNPRNARRHPAKQVAILAESIRTLGFTNPVLVDEDGEILAGHGRYAAARSLGLSEILIIRLMHLSSAEKRALALADNKIAELGSWDSDQLKETLAQLTDPSFELSFDIAITGFDTTEIDSILHPAASRRPDPADQLPDAGPSDQPVVTRVGDKWLCGDHVLVCENPLEVYFRELSAGANPAVVALVDPFPSTTELDLEDMVGHMQAWSERVAAQVCPGAMIYWFAAWQQIGVLTEAVQPVIGAPTDMIVWVRSDARPGALYQSQYEQVAVFVVGDGPPLRGAQLGRRARRRTNVWTHLGGDRGPHRRTGRKPVKLVIDMLKDCSAPGDIVLDLFAGSGTTMIAAQRAGRCARLMERDPRWCDVILRRWETLTKVPARHAESSATFAEIARERAGNGTPGES
jgi:hypothetical protein